jgi:deoxyribodipyrimidine photo-lyase
MVAPKALVWFRNDLRISDNPALLAGIGSGKSVLAVYIHETDAELRPRGGAAEWWLHRSLDILSAALAEIGIELRRLRGAASELLSELVETETADTVYWNRRYGLAEREIDARIKSALRSRTIEVKSFNAGLLIEPWDIVTKQGKPYSVFTPFWVALRDKQIRQPHPAPEGRTRRACASGGPDDAGYQPPEWSSKLVPIWKIGETAAQDKLLTFLETISGYETDRDFPARAATSLLSPHLHFGEIGPRQVWHAAMSQAHHCPDCNTSITKFLSELAWREFSYHQLFHRADISEHPMQPQFSAMQWRQDDEGFKAWCSGRTGYPIIDAGMRELWQTGYMHNRVRMLAASFLTKNLLIDWRRGEQWFWDCLVDADPASNPGNWQWVSGAGLDAAPWFRIFNPVIQGKRFDPRGRYVRQWLPEIAALPDKWLHRPFDAPSAALAGAGIVRGKTYPDPIVDLAASRKRALDALPHRSAPMKT